MTYNMEMKNELHIVFALAVNSNWNYKSDMCQKGDSVGNRMNSHNTQNIYLT